MGSVAYLGAMRSQNRALADAADKLAAEGNAREAGAMAEDDMVCRPGEVLKQRGMEAVCEGKCNKQHPDAIHALKRRKLR